MNCSKSDFILCVKAFKSNGLLENFQVQFYNNSRTISYRKYKPSSKHQSLLSLDFILRLIEGSYSENYEILFYDSNRENHNKFSYTVMSVTEKS